jgi:uncharacterized protein
MSNEPYFQIAINGRTVPPSMTQYVEEVTVEDAGSKASVARVVIIDWDKVWLNDSGIVKNNALSVDMGYLTDHRQMFKGKIKNIEAEYPEEGVPSLIITALDGDVSDMSKDKQSRTFKNMRVSDAISTLLKKHGLTPEVETMGGVQKAITQRNETDAAFIDRWAKKYGKYHYKTSKGTYYVGKKREETTKTDTIGYKVGNKAIKSFRPTFAEIEKQDT